MKYFSAIIFFILFSCSHKNWKEASRESIGIAPKAEELKEDIVQIYYARAFSWRGYFGIHPWVAWKKVEDSQYTVAQVTAWNLRRENTSVSVSQDLPDRLWFDSRPSVLFELRGKKARAAIEKMKPLIDSYPFSNQYRVWPGPNSNTFIAYLIRNVDELNLELPAHAVGKDYLGNQFFSKTASGTGYQLSLYGIFGLSLGLGEGIEFNLLGLNFGLDFWTPALKLPLVGRLGFNDKAL
ncbi:MAG: DUF3750 domain-containing protein [Halobacteriovoraceae bacterium]|nr:DUF3750 domain-containing protein [Halobacteriovoraceae bacterium]MCB9095276.1 DUF3750 domain-containing protein [Halobacteriovoraceae bacterium]